MSRRNSAGRGNVGRVSGFDELADDISDEDWDAAWEAYTSGADPLAGASTLRGFIDLPLGIIEVRGDDIGLTEVFPSARLGVGEADPADPDAVLDISGVGPVSWSLTNRRTDVTESGTCERPTKVTEAVLNALIRLDKDNIYIDAEIVDDGRLGVMLVDTSGEVDTDRSDIWVGTHWVVLSRDLVVVRPGSRTVTALRLVASSDGMPKLRVERSTIDVLVFVRPTGRRDHPEQRDLPEGGRRAADHAGNGDGFDTVRALFEQVHMPRRSMSFEEVGMVAAVVREIVAGALSLPVSRADLDDVPMGLTELARGDQLARLDPDGHGRRRWRDLVAQTVVPIAHAGTNSDAMRDLGAAAVLVGPALDDLDRGAPEALAIDMATGLSRDASLVDERRSEPPTTLEFLVGEDDRDVFEWGLINAGFQVVESALTNRDLHSTSQRSFRLADADGVTGVTGLTVLTTTEVGTGLFAGLLDLADFFTMSVPVRVGSAWIRGLGPSHRFILACIRFSSGADEATSRAMVVNNMPWNRIAAERVLRLADRCGAITPVRNTVKELSALVPPVLLPVLEELSG